jgi:hypothetical protein
MGSCFSLKTKHFFFEWWCPTRRQKQKRFRLLNIGLVGHRVRAVVIDSGSAKLQQKPGGRPAAGWQNQDKLSRTRIRIWQERCGY